MSDQPYARHWARVLIDERLLHELLQVPDDGTRILATTFEPMFLSVAVHVESPHLPPVEPGTQSPVIFPVTRQERRFNNDRLEYETRVTVEWPWQAEKRDR